MNKCFSIALLASFAATQVAFAGPYQNSNSGYLNQSAYSLSNQEEKSVYKKIEIDPDAPDKTFSLGFAFRARGSDVHDDNVNSTISVSNIDVDLNWNVTNWMKAQFLGGYQFASGNSSLIYGIEGTPYTGPAIDEGSFTYMPSQNFQFSAGIVDTQFSPISSTFAGSGFAGVREAIELKNGPFIANLTGYQVAPSSLSPANRALDDEKNPFLTVANLNLGLQYDRFNTAIGYTKYDFYGMTSASANDSRYIGNSVYGDGSDVVNYMYKFRGQEMALKVQKILRLDDKLTLSGHYTKNESAPAKRNAGWLSRTSYEYNFSRYAIRPSITRFRFEADLMPAFFSHGGLGFLNRDGYAGEIRAVLKKYKLEGYVRYVDSKEVEPKPTQSDRTNLTVGMEVKYEIL